MTALEQRVAHPSAGVHPTGSVRPLREMILIGLVFSLCPLVAWVAPGTPTGAVERALDMLELERAMGVDVEAAMRHWVTARPTLMLVAETLYLGLHVSALIGVLDWTAEMRPGIYRRLRDLFIASQLLTIAIYLRWPTAPPRLVDDGGVGPRVVGGLLERLQYEYAAVPSGHVVFAVVVAIGLQSSSSVWWRSAGLLYPGFVRLLVVVTGLHLVVDVMAGVAVVGAGALVCTLAHTVIRG